ncbi:MAG: universal stress protein [Planctomycetota bacterium]|nr:universal stress protein [Planctomycetaceae bacterium]MDQ3330209.1 universal stress protein [Planctomycetota bacterium]
MIAPKQRTIVVPVDFSDDSVGAIRAGLDRVEKPSDLHVVHVLMALDYSSPGVLREFASHENREEVAKRHVQELIDAAGAQGAHGVVIIGDPGLASADYAKSVKAELMVVASHGRHGVRRFLLGSTAERIIRHAHCSVLVLRRGDAS